MHTVFATRSRRTLGFLLIGFILTGCGGETTTAPPSTPPVVTNGSQVPVALRGTWSTVLAGTNQQVTLTLTERQYQITRGNDQATGAAAVTGNLIEFSQSSSCSGTGSYSWSVTGASLGFSTFAADPCPGRSEVLAGIIYTKGS